MHKFRRQVSVIHLVCVLCENKILATGFQLLGKAMSSIISYTQCTMQTSFVSNPELKRTWKVQSAIDCEISET